MNTNTEINHNGVNERATERNQLTLDNNTVENKAVRVVNLLLAKQEQIFQEQIKGLLWNAYLRQDQMWGDTEDGFGISEQWLADQVRTI